MDAAHITTLLTRLGCERITCGANWVRSTCPLARWRHATGRDRKPSFAVSRNADGPSAVRCLACGYKGPLIPMLWYLETCGQPVDGLFWFVVKHEHPDCREVDKIDKIQQTVKAATYWGPAPNLTCLTGPTLEPPKPLPTIPEHLLLALIPPPKQILQHLHEQRHLSQTAVDYWELGYSRKTHRLIVPIRARDGRLVAMSGRALRESARAKYLHTRGFKRDHVLYGEDKVVPGRVGYLHEGFFACIYAWQFGYTNNVARMGTHLSGYQEDRLVEWFSRLVIVPDGDKPGLDSAAEIYDRVQHRIPTTVAPMPFGSEVDRLSENELRKVMGSPETVIDSEVAAH